MNCALALYTFPEVAIVNPGPNSGIKVKNPFKNINEVIIKIIL